MPPDVVPSFDIVQRIVRWEELRLWTRTHCGVGLLREGRGILVLFPFLVHVFDGMFSPSCRRNSYCLQHVGELNFVACVVLASALADVAMLVALRGGGYCV